jgi:hypothetical protein
VAKKCRTPAPITDRVIHDETKCLRHAVDLACCKPADQPARRDRRIRGDATCRSDAGSRRQRRLAGVVRGSAWRSRRYRRRARGNRIEMKRVSHPYGRSVPVTTISTGSAAAPGAHKPGVPIRDRRPGAVALGHFRGIGLDLMPAIEAPDDQPQSCCRGIAEGHSYFVLPKSGVIRPRIASPSGVSRQYPPSNLAQLHRRHFAAPYLPRNQPDTALRAYRRRHDR